jgi:hypothetical protein
MLSRCGQAPGSPSARISSIRRGTWLPTSDERRSGPPPLGPYLRATPRHASARPRRPPSADSLRGRTLGSIPPRPSRLDPTRSFFPSPTEKPSESPRASQHDHSLADLRPRRRFANITRCSGQVLPDRITTGRTAGQDCRVLGYSLRIYSSFVRYATALSTKPGSIQRGGLR